jgi:hypothetical protein
VLQKNRQQAADEDVIGPGIKRKANPFFADVKAEVKDQSIDVDQNDGGNQDVREPSKLLMKYNEYAGPQKIELFFDRQRPGVLGGVDDVWSQGKTVIAGIEKGTQIVEEQRSIGPCQHKPTRGHRQDQEDVEGGKDAENAADIEVADGYISGSFRLIEQHPGNQKTAEDKEGQHAPAFRKKRNMQMVANYKKYGDRAQSVERWDLLLAEAGAQSRIQNRNARKFIRHGEVGRKPASLEE